MPPTKMKREPDDEGYDSGPKRVRKQVEKGSEEYVAKRERNNVAVKKSREKSRAKAAETQVKVQRLKNENAHLEQKVELLQKELSVLKDLFLAHAGAVRQEEIAANNGGGGTGGTFNNAGTIAVNQKAVRNDHEYTAALS